MALSKKIPPRIPMEQTTKEDYYTVTPTCIRLFFQFGLPLPLLAVLPVKSALSWVK